MADRTSKIILAKNVKMDRELKNVVNYTNSQMLTMLTDTTHFVSQSNTYSFIRTTGTIQTDFNYSDALQSNYIAFQNYDYSQKWFFAWIEEVIYKGERNTEIRYKVDPFSTFNGDLTYENCFVVREHVNDDTIGLHTIPEDIDAGEMIIESASQITELSADNYYLAIETDAHPTGESYVVQNNPQITKFSGARQYNKLFFGHEIIIIKTNNDLNNFIDRMNKDDAIEFIKTLFIVPSTIFGENDLLENFAYNSTENQGNKFYFYHLQPSQTIEIFNGDISKNTIFTGITIKNNKCKVWPYNYLLVSNSVGQTHVYKYEDFSDTTCKFDVVGCISVGGSFKLVPKNYKGISANYDESISLAKYPTCSWSADSYTNWLTQQSVNEYAAAGTNIIQSGLQGLAVGGIHGGVAMAGLGLAGEVGDLIGNFKEAKLTPNVSGGSNTGDINWAMGGNNFIYKKMHCKKEYMSVVDEYFTRYGYKVNSLKTPNVTGRTYFNYVQVGPSEDACFGSIPEMYMDEIIKAFRRGITIWHDASKIGDYSVLNTIVT